jgi:hypothetical protein
VAGGTGRRRRALVVYSHAPPSPQYHPARPRIACSSMDLRMVWNSAFQPYSACRTVEVVRGRRWWKVGGVGTAVHLLLL